MIWIRKHGDQQELDFDDVRGKEQDEMPRVPNNMAAVMINGTQLLFNRIYDGIGFIRIPDQILCHIVIARVSQPGSKLATVSYLKSYYDEDVDLNRYQKKSSILFTVHRGCFATFESSHRPCRFKSQSTHPKTTSALRCGTNARRLP